MQGVLQPVIWFFMRLLLHLRYKVEVHGLEKLKGIKGPVLVWPNHPAFVDPPMILSHLRFGKQLRPLVFTGSYRNPVAYPLMRTIGAFEVPSLSSHSRDAHKQTNEMIDNVAERIKQGESFLIYPSGRLQRTAKEVIGGARIAHDLLERCENVTVVLVRTKGLWGSAAGCAPTGQVPDLGKKVPKGIMWMLANLIFFAPRRKVSITVEAIERDQLPIEDKTKLNSHLEEWYNSEAATEAKFVPFHFCLGPRDFDYSKVKLESSVDADSVPLEIQQAISEELESHLGRPLEADETGPAMSLDQLGLDSLERMDMALALERRFGFRSDDVPATIGELWLLAQGELQPDEDKPLEIPKNWKLKQPPNADIPKALGSSIGESFIKRVLLQPDDVAVADQLSGALTYRRLLVGSSLLSKRLAKIDSDNVAIMLPASVAADMVLMASHLAGKLPIMLNWTTGPAGLSHAVNKLDIKYVVTSKRFMDRLGVEMPDVEMIYLEDFRKELGTVEKLTTLLATYLAPKSFLRALPATNEDDPAVVLFTSGSENAPKAVPLSHKNLLSNMNSGVKLMGFRCDDTLLGFLPPFHSFGLSTASLAPLLAGIRLIHHPDPTDSRGLARIIDAYQPTLMFATPTFLQYILGAASDDELRSLRSIMVGAEKCPAAIQETVSQRLPDVYLIEGYGITECSPVVAANPPGDIRPGTIGTAIDCVETCVVHPDTFEPQETNQTGLLLVRGPSIFNGYLAHDGDQPFVECNGKQWYNTGDLTAIDEDGFIHFRGRLKRFIKSGGEMISLPALESPFSELFPTTEDGPQAAVEGIELEGGRNVVLFITQEYSLRDANKHLQESGFQGVMRLDDVRKVDSIPVLGTGKTDYRTLRQWVIDS
ncbi:MAG: hypothetical protein COA78_19510 [Blastopirellula sp.]|nr:MAG: hypothetical protein COA78_19510 [Blastopirellula sp.]